MKAERVKGQGEGKRKSITEMKSQGQRESNAIEIS